MTNQHFTACNEKGECITVIEKPLSQTTPTIQGRVTSKKLSEYHDKNRTRLSRVTLEDGRVAYYYIHDLRTGQKSYHHAI